MPVVQQKKLIVYRVDDGKRGLANTNAGNILGVLNHLEFCEDRMIAAGEYLSIFEVEFDGCFGNYVSLVRGRLKVEDNLEQKVGISEKEGSIWYSFPEQARWNSRKLSSIPLSTIFDYLKQKGADPAVVPGNTQARMIEEYLFSISSSFTGNSS